MLAKGGGGVTSEFWPLSYSWTALLFLGQSCFFSALLPCQSLLQLVNPIHSCQMTLGVVELCHALDLSDRLETRADVTWNIQDTIWLYECPVLGPTPW